MILVEKAEAFARAAHGAIHQKRDFSGADYITHPEDCVRRALTRGTTDEVLLAALWVHDVLEDVAAKDADFPGLNLAESFGPVAMARELGNDVLVVVLGLTNQFSKVAFPMLNRETRKMLEKVRLAGWAAHPVHGWRVHTAKAVDIASNTQCLFEECPESFARTYAKEKAAMLEVLTLADGELLAAARANLRRP